MKHSFSIWLLALAVGVPAAAQQMMTSHAPTSMATQPVSVVQSQHKPVARVNGAVLTESDLLREEYTIFPYARQHNGSIPPEMAPDIRNGALKDDHL